MNLLVPLFIIRYKGDWARAYRYASVLLRESRWSKVSHSTTALIIKALFRTHTFLFILIWVWRLLIHKFWSAVSMDIVENDDHFNRKRIFSKTHSMMQIFFFDNIARLWKQRYTVKTEVLKSPFSHKALYNSIMKFQKEYCNAILKGPDWGPRPWLFPFVSTDVIYVSESVLQSHGETNKPRVRQRKW